MQIQLSINKNFQIPQYQKMVEETEHKHQSIIKILQSIQVKEIQDIFYILKPTQQLYNCVCGLLCFLAGVDRGISTDYLFLQQRDWVASQSLFCKNYESIAQNLINIQENSLKKRINVTNIKEAMKYETSEQKIEQITIADKLQRVLHFSIFYYNSFYKILKYNQKYEQEQKTPKKQDSVKQYMLNKIKNFDQDSEEEEQDEGETQEIVMHSTPQDVHTPIKQLNRFKDFNSYQKGVTCNPKITISKQRNQNYLSKSPKLRIKSEQSSEPLNFQEHVSVTTFQTQPIEKPKPKPKPQQSPRVSKPDSVKKKETFSLNSPNLGSLAEKVKNNESGIERQLQFEIENVQRQVKKIEGLKRQLAWEDERQSKKAKEQEEQQYQSQSFEQNKKFLEDRQQFLKESRVQKVRFEKIKPQEEEKINFEKQKVQSLFRELERCVKEKERLEQEADWMKEQVYVKNSGIQKY